jgi:tetratricopeptide repeat protein
MRKESSTTGGAAMGAEDPYIIQRLALATYKSKHPTSEQAFQDARDLLSLLDAKVSNGTETLGLWGSVHKRMWDKTKNRSYLDQAIRGYERGFYLRNDFYNGINYAFLLNERAVNSADLAEREPLLGSRDYRRSASRPG